MPATGLTLWEAAMPATGLTLWEAAMPATATPCVDRVRART